MKAVAVVASMDRRKQRIMIQDIVETARESEVAKRNSFQLEA